MIKRFAAAVMGICIALGVSEAEAKAYHGHKHSRGEGSYGVSRSCLTSAAQALLGRIEAQFGSVQLVSTCRPGARIAGSGKISRHASGNAIDFSAGNRKGAIVKWLIANHHSGGTMTYARMSHIHVDIGPRFVSLNSGSGGRRYASRRNGRGKQVAQARFRGKHAAQTQLRGKQTYQIHSSRHQYTNGYAGLSR